MRIEDNMGKKIPLVRFKNLFQTFVRIAFVLLITTSMVILPVLSAPNLGPNVNITGNSYNQNEPHIAINPADSNKLVVGYNDYRNKDPSTYYLYYPQVGWSYSDNGGETWIFGGEVSLASHHFSGDPVVAFGSGGSNAYLAGLAWNSGDSDGSIWIAKSTNGGHSFGAPTIVAAGSGTTTFLDKPWIYVNPSNDHVYMAWTKIVNRSLATEERSIWFTRSINGGSSFSAPIKVSDITPATGTGRSHAAQITSIGTNVYVSWKTLQGTGRGTSTYQSPKIYIAGSTDDGVSFGASNLVTSLQQGGFNLFDSMDADPSSGRIYITYSDTSTYSAGPPIQTDYNVYVAFANQVSGPWNIVRVDDSSVVSAQSWPALDVAPNGRVDIIWYDSRSGKTDLYYSSSTNGGVTWETNTKITSTNWDWPSNFVGDYIAIASTNTKVHPVWMDNRTTNPGPMPEIFTATLTNCITISSPGTFTLTQSGSDCILINSNNVILDGMGYTLQGNDIYGDLLYPTGVQVSPGFSNVTIKNLVLKNWFIGIGFRLVTNGNIENNVLTSNQCGIDIGGSANNNIINNDISDLGQAFSLDLLYNGDTRNNFIYNNNFRDSSTFAISENLGQGMNSWNYYGGNPPIPAIKSGINIVGGPNIGGNFWGKKDGSGLSQNCADADKNGICDSVTKTVDGSNNIDYFPLANPPVQSIASIASSTNNGIVTFEASSGNIANLVAVNPSSLPTPPGGTNLLYGVFSFDITGIVPGSSVTMTLTFPNTLPTGTEYWKYQPTHIPPWYSIPAVISGNKMTLTLTDNGLGDANPDPGVISDPGGPSIPQGGSRTEVPEFPTIALPIVGIIGLMFLFQRRKGK